FRSMLPGATGQILDKVSWTTAAADNVALARGTGGACDAPPAGASLQLESACDGGVCQSGSVCYTPGKTAAGNDFQPPPAPPGETCANAIPLTAGAPPLTNQSTAGYLSDYNIVAAAGRPPPPRPPRVG